MGHRKTLKLVTANSCFLKVAAEIILVSNEYIDIFGPGSGINHSIGFVFSLKRTMSQGLLGGIG